LARGPAGVWTNRRVLMADVPMLRSDLGFGCDSAVKRCRARPSARVQSGRGQGPSHIAGASMPLLARASTLAAAWLRALRHTLKVL